ncbi:MAG TPA: Gfo/Idh/MocA family oxidoreductase [Isosphaeraceae bacterium]|nr:Gfo/Idh/MocA family oxidoreductase [Isosphaeraceae bacterium]
MPGFEQDGRAHLPSWPAHRDVGIGVVGAGFIVRDCHLVAYAEAGFPVVGITSRTHERAREVADARGIARVFPSLEEPAVAIVDIAVPPAEQPAVLGFATRLRAERPWIGNLAG